MKQQEVTRRLVLQSMTAAAAVSCFADVGQAAIPLLFRHYAEPTPLQLGPIAQPCWYGPSPNPGSVIAILHTAWNSRKRPTHCTGIADRHDIQLVWKVAIGYHQSTNQRSATISQEGRLSVSTKIGAWNGGSFRFCAMKGMDYETARIHSSTSSAKHDSSCRRVGPRRYFNAAGIRRRSP